MRQIRLLPTLAILLALGLWAAVASQPIAHAQQNLLVNPALMGNTALCSPNRPTKSGLYAWRLHHRPNARWLVPVVGFPKRHRRRTHQSDA
ncbi:MAG: hypothetical protein IPL28_07485 [Chloroflexi bacterium]|nr:hypothetical protein [Chloroflexota bacterium]